ncbi:PepSY-like domain-containing protein [Salinimicrobium sp. TIG7-5_MAKvit]|uniref:PepSY-like domain-containing protein n=1 Tax=Salinimicrobium sp. TIG7-5_MAKvit TaxID=3121289 RepID=UPI003C6E7F74
MNLRSLFLLLLSIFLLSCDNDDYPYAKVPSVVRNAFWTQYPDATDAKFIQLDENYEVEFEIDEEDGSAVISPSGNIVKEKREIEWNDLPAEVQETLRKTYGQKKIEDPERVRIGEEIHYQVEVSRFFIDDEIVLTAAGKIDTNLNYWK